ncbi:MAG: redox-regulated ATPase YchF [Patescibacteria group bacterium]
MLEVGIIGLPNVGKSTLFNALLKKQVADTSNYPFCTIEPNVGVVEVPDQRPYKIADTLDIQPVIPAAVEFYDIAGLVEGAHQGEGLGNQFLSNIREVTAIVHVVRLFENPNVPSVSDQISPKEDIKTINAELMLADLEVLERQEITKGKRTKEEQEKAETLEKAENLLNEGTPLHKAEFSKEETKILRKFNLLTTKPVIYLFNVSESQLENREETKANIKAIMKKTGNSNETYLILSAMLEREINDLEPEEQKEYLEEFNLEDTGLDRFIKKTYQTLELISFFTTVGGKEVRAWTTKESTPAPEAGGRIHSDFKENFIRVDVIFWQDLIKARSWKQAREKGKVETHGRDYQIQDGEVVEFKISR